MRLSNKSVQHSNFQSSKEKLNFSVSTEEEDDVFEGEKLVSLFIISCRN